MKSPVLTVQDHSQAIDLYLHIFKHAKRTGQDAGWNPMATRDQIIAQEFQDIQADQTISEQLKIAANELKNPSIQQKSAYRTQTTSMPSLTEWRP